MDRDTLRRLCLSLALVLAIVLACRRSDEARAPSGPPPQQQPQILDFPAELHAEDESVNAFVRQVIETCASGDYDAFRLLWSARDDPFPRDQFHRAWQSVQKVKIVSLRPFRAPETRELLYAVRAHVRLDPGVREPERDVTILLVRNEGRWQLTSPPRDVPDGLFERTTPTSQPQGQSGLTGVP